MALLSEAEIFDACKGGDQDRVVSIISQGTDPRQVRNHDFMEETLLHTACRYVTSVIDEPALLAIYGSVFSLTSSTFVLNLL